MTYDQCKPYQSISSHGRGKRWKSEHVQDIRGLNIKIYLAVDANGMPVKILITEGIRADCKEAVRLIESISAEVLLADRGYDTNDILAYAVSAGMQAVIPSKKNRTEQRQYDKHLYKLRHLIENCFLLLKRWRGIATRYTKTSDAFLTAVQIVASLFGLSFVPNTNLKLKTLILSRQSKQQNPVLPTDSCFRC